MLCRLRNERCPYCLLRVSLVLTQQLLCVVLLNQFDCLLFVSTASIFLNVLFFFEWVWTNGGDLVTITGQNFGLIQTPILLISTEANHAVLQNINVLTSDIVEWNDEFISFHMPVGLGIFTLR